MGSQAIQSEQSEASKDPQADSKIGEGMNPLRDDREHYSSRHVEHTKQAASPQSQLTNQQRHLYGKVATIWTTAS